MTEFTLNGRPVRSRSPGTLPLLQVLREEFGLRAARFGCGEGACGACTVIVDGRAAVSCTLPIGALAGAAVQTAESLAAGPERSPREDGAAEPAGQAAGGQPQRQGHPREAAEAGQPPGQARPGRTPGRTTGEHPPGQEPPGAASGPGRPPGQGNPPAGGAEHPLVAAFIAHQAGQCGYCLPGILMAAKALLDAEPMPARSRIAAALDGNLCRCGAHVRILDAVEAAARQLAGRG